jgi:hypothetical protein
MICCSRCCAFCLAQGTPVIDRAALLDLIDAVGLAYGAYKKNPQSLCAVTHLPVSHDSSDNIMAIQTLFMTQQVVVK